jgi:hypothetical protein
MSRLTLAFVVGLLVGVFACAAFMHQRNEHAESIEAKLVPPKETAQVLELPEAAVSPRSTVTASAQPATEQPAPVAAPVRDQPTPTHRQRRDNYWNGLPDIDACLARRDLNPDGLSCPNDAVRKQLGHLIDELNIPIAELADARNAQIDQVAKGKIGAGVDPKATWQAYPDSMIIARSGITSVVGGKETKGETVVLKGDDPDLDATIEQLMALKLEALKKMKEQIAALCVH